MSKLYTEEQLKKAWNTAYVDALALDNEDYKPIFYDDFIASLTPIQLPSDEEIVKNAYGYVVSKWEYAQDENIESFIVGANWMRDKIKGGQGE